MLLLLLLTRDVMRVKKGGVPWQADLDILRQQLGRCERRRVATSTAESLEARGAIVGLPAFLRASSDAGAAVLQAGDAEALDGRAGYEDAADAACAVFMGGGGFNCRPGQLGELRVAGSRFGGECLRARCKGKSCQGNTLSVEDDGSISVFFTHHKCQRAWGGAPVQFRLEVRS